MKTNGQIKRSREGDMILYFAYGSNLNHAHMAFRCPGARPVGPAILHGYRMEFQNHYARRKMSGVATVIPTKGQDVVGGVWLITEKDLENLDHYEGYPYLYTRREVKVKLADREVWALIYIMRPGVASYPAPEYYATIRTGFTDFGLSQTHLLRAIEQTARGRYAYESDYGTLDTRARV